MNTVNMEIVPRLDLSPRLKRMLSLWNPLDYLRLFYWVFFFPQAIRWYVEQFGNPKYLDKERRGSWEKYCGAWREDPVRRRLLVQALLLTFIALFCISWWLSAIGIPINWYIVMIGVAGGVVMGVASSLAEDVAYGVTYGVIFCVMLNPFYSVFSGVMFGGADGVAVGVTLGVAVGMLYRMSFDVWRSMLGEIKGCMVGGRTFLIALAVGIGSAVFIVVSEKSGEAVGTATGVTIIITMILISTRLLDYILSTFLSRFTFKSNHRFRFPLVGHVVFFPLPGLQKRLQEWLRRDWTAGSDSANQFLEFTMQFIPVVNAVNNVLSQSPTDTLLKKISILADRPYDWKLLQFGSADLNKRLKRVRLKQTIDMRVDTLPRAACAGFWHWHEQEAAQAVEAFARVRDIAHGEELYNTAAALQKGLEITDFSQLPSWEEETKWLDALPGPGLRPGAIKTLRILNSAAGEARTALRSQALALRSTAINRAVDDMSNLVKTGRQDCPEPEWPMVRDIAQKWLDLFQTLGGQVGKEAQRTPIRNPYIGFSGLPVSGETFVGRDDTMRKIETRWAADSPLPTLFLYGHRRMGKTSILKNLEQTSPPSSIYVYLNMQAKTLITHTGQFFLDIAVALHEAAQKIGPDVCAAPQKQDYTDPGAARQALDTLLKAIHALIRAPQRIILAIDEFEYIEKGIAQGKIDPGLPDYLRAINQDYHWLGLIFAGLHTLEEMGRDYREAFFCQAEALRVSFLPYEETLRLITRPYLDFSLEYGEALIEEIYRLTHGQPYLVQCICWELVNRWNDRYLKEGETLPRLLEPEDLPSILTGDFFKAADYYFSGVWSNITPAEQTLLRLMCPGENAGRTREELAAAYLHDEPLEKTIKLLFHHDVILEDETGLRFASELMRRWVEETPPGGQGALFEKT